MCLAVAATGTRSVLTAVSAPPTWLMFASNLTEENFTAANVFRWVHQLKVIELILGEDKKFLKHYILFQTFWRDLSFELIYFSWILNIRSEKHYQNCQYVCYFSTYTIYVCYKSINTGESKYFFQLYKAKTEPGNSNSPLPPPSLFLSPDWWIFSWLIFDCLVLSILTANTPHGVDISMNINDSSGRIRAVIAIFRISLVIFAVR